MFSVGLPIVFWAILVAAGWFFPLTKRLFLITAPLVFVMVVFGFSVLVKGLRVWIALLLAILYFPAMYVLLMYLDVVVSTRLYGTYF